MNRLALALALSVSAASGAAVSAKLASDVYVPPVASDVAHVGVDPNGVCPKDATPFIRGGRPGTCFETLASVDVRSTRASIPSLPVPHRSPSNPVAEETLRALIATVALPRLAALEPVRSNPDIWDAPSLADLEPVLVYRPAGNEPRLYLCGLARSKRVGVPDQRLCDSSQPPKEALTALLPLLDGLVLPAVTAEVFP